MEAAATASLRVDFLSPKGLGQVLLLVAHPCAR